MAIARMTGRGDYSVAAKGRHSRTPVRRKNFGTERSEGHLLANDQLQSQKHLSCGR